MYSIAVLKESLLLHLRCIFSGREVIIQQAQFTDEVAVGILFKCSEVARDPMVMIDAFIPKKPAPVRPIEVDYHADQLARLGHAAQHN